MRALLPLLEQLRQAGFDISLAEVLEAHALLSLAGGQEELFYGLRSILAKTAKQQQLFELFWQSYGLKPTETATSTNMIDSDRLQAMQEELSEMAANIGTGGAEDPASSLLRFSSSYKGVVKQLLQGNDRNAAAMLLRYLLDEVTTPDQFLQKQQIAMGEVREMLEAISSHADLLMSQFEALLDDVLQDMLAHPPAIRGINPFKADPIADIPLFQLKHSEELSMLLRRMGRRLATRYRQRLRHGNRKIDLRRTIRQNIQHGGVLLQLQRQRRRKSKPRLIILTDISDSTIHATKLFLQLLWHAREVFTDIRFFEFIGSCIEVTPLLRRATSVDEAIGESLQAWQAITVGKQNSNYYQAMGQFIKKAPRLSQRTTIIILGDMRDWLGPWDNGIPKTAQLLGNLVPKVNRIIVLNPELQALWDTGDSICRYCTAVGVEIHEATTLTQLQDALLEI